METETLMMVMVVALALCMTLVVLAALFVVIWYMKQLSYAAELAVRATSPGAEVETYHDQAIADAMAAGRKPPLVPEGLTPPGGSPGPGPRREFDEIPASVVGDERR